MCGSERVKVGLVAGAATRAEWRRLGRNRRMAAVVRASSSPSSTARAHGSRASRADTTVACARRWRVARTWFVFVQTLPRQVDVDMFHWPRCAVLGAWKLARAPVRWRGLGGADPTEIGAWWRRRCARRRRRRRWRAHAPPPTTRGRRWRRVMKNPFNIIVRDFTSKTACARCHLNLL